MTTSLINKSDHLGVEDQIVHAEEGNEVLVMDDGVEIAICRTFAGLEKESDCGQGDTGSDSTEEGSESFGSDIEVQIAKIHLVT
jgi:hypothetical protein